MSKGGISGKPGQGIKRYFASRLAQLGTAPKVHITFDCGYAYYVHENLNATHDNGQAKFLETPARRMAKQLTKQVADDLRGGKQLVDAMVDAATMLMTEAKRLCPVDTGKLRDSAKVVVEQRK